MHYFGVFSFPNFFEFLKLGNDTRHFWELKPALLMFGILCLNMFSCKGLIEQTVYIKEKGHAESIPTLYNYYFFMAMAPSFQYAFHNSLGIMMFTSLTRVSVSIPLIYLLLKSHGMPTKTELLLLSGCVAGCLGGVYFPPLITLAYAANGFVIALLSFQKPYLVYKNGNGAVCLKSEIKFTINQFFWTIYGLMMNNLIIVFSCGLPFILGLFTIKLLKGEKQLQEA